MAFLFFPLSSNSRPESPWIWDAPSKKKKREKKLFNRIAGQPQKKKQQRHINFLGRFPSDQFHDWTLRSPSCRINYCQQLNEKNKHCDTHYSVDSVSPIASSRCADAPLSLALNSTVDLHHYRLLALYSRRRDGLYKKCPSTWTARWSVLLLQKERLEMVRSSRYLCSAPLQYYCGGSQGHKMSLDFWKRNDNVGV